MTLKIQKMLLTLLLSLGIFSCGGNSDEEHAKLTLLSEIIVFNFQTHLTQQQRLVRIEQYLERVDHMKINFVDLKGAHVNAICMLLDEASEIVQQKPHIHLESVKSKLKNKVDTVEFAYLLFKECRDLYDLEFKSPVRT
ncbi:hypothetical protein [Shewanella maritima]|uniref:hypothetical protein n=1 Tax=Shewanella maritima TaxID=2520507 RepID=UPI0037353ECE